MPARLPGSQQRQQQRRFYLHILSVALTIQTHTHSPSLSQSSLFFLVYFIISRPFILTTHFHFLLSPFLFLN